MEIKLYNYAGNHLVVNKTLAGEKTISGNLKGMTVSNDGISLRILCGADDILNYNYMYIAELKRYYFIDSIELNVMGILTVNGSVDYLKSFEDEILRSTCEVIECENNYNGDFVDYEPNTKETIAVFSGDNPFTSERSIILVANKGETIAEQ